MKARLKNGEVINIADYSRVELDKCDSYGNPISVGWDEIENLIEEDGLPLGFPRRFSTGIIMPTDNTDWNKVRRDAAIAAMQGLFASRNIDIHRDDVVEIAIGYADELVCRLKEKVNEEDKGF